MTNSPSNESDRKLVGHLHLLKVAIRVRQDQTDFAENAVALINEAIKRIEELSDDGSI
jgi:hypothetical protein